MIERFYTHPEHTDRYLKYRVRQKRSKFGAATVDALKRFVKPLRKL